LASVSVQLLPPLLQGRIRKTLLPSVGVPCSSEDSGSGVKKTPVIKGGGNKRM